MAAEIHYCPAAKLVANIKAGHISSRDLLEQYAARIAEKNGRINAVVSTNLEMARRQADAAVALGN